MKKRTFFFYSIKIAFQFNLGRLDPDRPHLSS